MLFNHTQMFLLAVPLPLSILTDETHLTFTETVLCLASAKLWSIVRPPRAPRRIPAMLELLVQTRIPANLQPLTQARHCEGSPHPSGPLGAMLNAEAKPAGVI